MKVALSLYLAIVAQTPSRIIPFHDCGGNVQLLLPLRMILQLVRGRGMRNKIERPLQNRTSLSLGLVAVGAAEP